MNCTLCPVPSGFTCRAERLQRTSIHLLRECKAMPHRRVPSRRFALESLEHRMTPSSFSMLPVGLTFFSQAEDREHSFAPSFQSMNGSLQMQSFSLQGFGNLFRQVLVVDLSIRISFFRIDFSMNNSSLWQFSSQV